MGTRSLICVYYKGRFVIAQYSQWDGYPEGQGKTILQFLQVWANIERLKNGLQYIAVLEDDEVESIYNAVAKAQRNNSGHDSNCKCGKPHGHPGQLPPSLSRDTGAKILELIAQATADSYVPVYLNLDFVNDSLFCEWAYVVDLDNDVFEVFASSVSKASALNDRFANVGDKDERVPELIQAFPFTQLPTDTSDMINQLNVIIEKLNKEHSEAGAKMSGKEDHDQEIQDE
jgi:hypothetical protein